MAPRRLRIAFLDSWKANPHEGSGTAVGIGHLGRGLESLGHRVERLAAGSGRGPFLLSRLRYNLGLERRLREGGPWDLVVGFDVDGVLVRGGPPRVVCLKGVAADEARFESGRARLLLSALARIEAANARRAVRVVVPSRYSAGVAVQAYGIAPSVIRVVPEPLELARWDRLHEVGIPKATEPTILSVARQYPRKDTATLVRALPRVQEQVPEVRLRIIGGGPELDRLRALARQAGVADRVRFDGAVPDDDDVRRAYFQAHVFCLPSRQEGFGIAFAEAMAAGLPVVAARAGAVPEVVLHGQTGLLTPPGDPATLAQALVRVLTDPETAVRMGRNGRERVREFDVEAVAERFLEAVRLS